MLQLSFESVRHPFLYSPHGSSVCLVAFYLITLVISFSVCNMICCGLAIKRGAFAAAYTSCFMNATIKFIKCAPRQVRMHWEMFPFLLLAPPCCENVTLVMPLFRSSKRTFSYFVRTCSVSVYCFLMGKL
jgi:hypothetical protein